MIDRCGKLCHPFTTQMRFRRSCSVFPACTDPHEKRGTVEEAKKIWEWCDRFSRQFFTDNLYRNFPIENRDKADPFCFLAFVLLVRQGPPPTIEEGSSTVGGGALCRPPPPCDSLFCTFFPRCLFGEDDHRGPSDVHIELFFFCCQALPSTRKKVFLIPFISYWKLLVLCLREVAGDVTQFRDFLLHFSPCSVDPLPRQPCTASLENRIDGVTDGQEVF